MSETNDWIEKREAGMKRVNHFLGLKNGVITERVPAGERYIHVVSGGCTLAIAGTCFGLHSWDTQFDFQAAYALPDSILFVTKGDDFKFATSVDLLLSAEEYKKELEKISVADIHDIFSQKWQLQGAFWPLAYAKDIRTGIFIERPSDQKVCRVIGGCPGKVVLYELSGRRH